MYKAVHRVLAGGTAWSSLLGAWVGPANGMSLGRPAKGVPEGFLEGGGEKKDGEGDVVMKVEEGEEGVKTLGEEEQQQQQQEKHLDASEGLTI